MQEIRKVLGKIPILASGQRLLNAKTGVDGARDEAVDKERPKTDGTSRPKVLADGTYATEAAYTSTTTVRLEAVKAAPKPPLQSELSSFSKWHYVDMMLALILAGDFFTGSILAVALTKLVLRFDDKSQNPTASNILCAEVRSVFLELFLPC